MRFIHLAIVLGAAMCLTGCGKSGASGGASGGSGGGIPQPPGVTVPLGPARRGYDFGYFYSDWEQAAETGDHVTIAHIPSGGDWSTPDGRQAVIDAAIIMLQRAREAGIGRAVVTLDFCGWGPDHAYLGDDVAGERVAAFFAQLREARVLDLVVGCYSVDEPEREVDVSADELRAFCAVVRRVAGMYGITPALCIIYGDGTYGGRGRDYRALEAHDWIGRDAYDERDGALGEPYDDVAARLRPDQRIILVPGVAHPWRERLGPWYAKANQDERVVWLCPFSWVGYAGQPNGARHNGMATHCREYGKAIKEAA